ncbi:uncharacterized protein LOC128885615 isoform X1 [Hylaeus anthracinus]|uniref:uncharacterized protein LOC128885615 isoform X1 n=1 Tax=Hylaeus anthracinus TaxID=313031 RepID=UPI0023B98740|nr:uncharacterized protein LOC128885615 isoform X1 [Hylaeus anthracinus]
MSINVTVNGNPLSIRRGRMVLSDLDQIKKNERDRRRRLRLEQVRQQSKEISDRLLERAKNIAKQELRKLENNDKLPLKQIHNGKIMEIQQKYQEDMADIGQAHVSAIAEPDHTAIIQEKERRNKLTASKRGKEAMRQINNLQHKETMQQLHQERLRQVRELENLRSTMIAKIPQDAIPEKSTIQVEIDEENRPCKSTKKKPRKNCFRKSPGKITKSYIKVVTSDFKTCSPRLVSKSKTARVVPKKTVTVTKEQSVVNSVAEPSTLKTAVPTNTAEQVVHAHESEYRNNSQNAVPVSNATSTEVDKSPRYNPEDYVQSTSDSTITTYSDDSSSLCSDDSPYSADADAQSVCVKPQKYVSCSANDKVQLYDHSKHQYNMYNKPVGVVEKIHVWNEPSAIDLAKGTKEAETVETHLAENRKSGAQKRGDDAVLRERVRRDYQALVQNLNHLVSEERKLKASQIERYPEDVYTQEERRKILRDQHKKKLNRSVKTLVNEECFEQCPSYPMERQITLPPRGNDKSIDTGAVWEDQYLNECTETSKSSHTKCKETENSREEQILDMLKKVERQKKLLLQEFGADLPDNVFNATMKPLFEKEKATKGQSSICHNTDIQQPLSPELKVISCCDEDMKKDKVVENGNTSVKKVEIAVQTSTGSEQDVAQDKSIQVELIQEKNSESNDIDTEISTTKHIPIEPKVTVITPAADSSELTSSTVTDTINDIDQQSPTLSHQNEKQDTKTMKHVPPKTFQKSSVVSVSKTPSPAKKYSRTLSRSRCSSIKKTSNSATDTPSKKIKIYVNKSGFNIKVDPPQAAEVAVDVSTQSSQIHSTGTQEQTTSKLFCVQSQAKRVKTKDISDTSTSFASPPPIKPRDILEALSNNMSIFEMLDSSTNESMRFLKRDISPVSTPETPSPRTMRMPSNIPHLAKINRMLRYASIDSQENGTSVMSSTKNDHSSSTNLSSSRRNGHSSPEQMISRSKQSADLQELCSCENPECKLMHSEFDNIRNYALKNCPQILQKYEDLQTLCAERIVSLTNLIEKVRSEQKGVELSVISAGDETSLMQLPPPKVIPNDLQSVRNLVENIEAIHNQLAKTLIETQRIVKNNTVLKEDSNQFKEIDVVTQTTEKSSKNVTHHMEPEAVTQKAKSKPKIINEERVNIRLDGYKILYKPQASTAIPSESNSQHTSNFHDEEVIEKLSKEILEQSKSFKNNLIATRDTDSSPINHTVPASTDTIDSKNNPSSRTQKTNVATQEDSNKKLNRNKEFVPLLADIPKISRTTENVFTNGRSKPPVSLLSGLYRTEIESSGHELSTIIEFDTPDTVNKSHNNVKSPFSMQKTAATQVTKSTSITKPPEHAVPSLHIRDQHFKQSYNLATSKVSTMVSSHTVEQTGTRLDSSKIPTNTGGRNEVTNDNKEKKDSSQVETNNKKLPCDTANYELFQPASGTNTNPNEQEPNNKDKITSTSSNSFSGLSGISQITSTPSSDMLKYASSPEEMEIALKKLGLGWAITTLKKTREASALSSSSNSDDRTPINTAKRIISPIKKQLENNYGLPDFSDVSSISIKEASKSTEQAVLLKGRTSTPKLQNSNSNSERTNSTSSNISEHFQNPNKMV